MVGRAIYTELATDHGQGYRGRDFTRHVHRDTYDAHSGQHRCFEGFSLEIWE
jgi:hypothetical protein